jgi:hypothetical protein
MSQQQQSPLLAMPAEIRLNVYSYLLNDGGHQSLSIRNQPDSRYNQWELGVGLQRPVLPRQSTKYHVMERTSMFSRRCFETTYHLASQDAEFHVSAFSDIVLAIPSKSLRHVAYIISYPPALSPQASAELWPLACIYYCLVDFQSSSW